MKHSFIWNNLIGWKMYTCILLVDPRGQTSPFKTISVVGNCTLASYWLFREGGYHPLKQSHWLENLHLRLIGWSKRADITLWNNLIGWKMYTCVLLVDPRGQTSPFDTISLAGKCPLAFYWLIQEGRHHSLKQSHWLENLHLHLIGWSKRQISLFETI